MVIQSQARHAENAGSSAPRAAHVHAGLLPVCHCPRRASLVKAVGGRRTTGHRGNMPGARTREDGLDKPGPESRGVRTHREQEGYGPDLPAPGAAPSIPLPEGVPPRFGTLDPAQLRGGRAVASMKPARGARAPIYPET